MMPGTRSVYFLYLTGSSILQRASQYAGIFVYPFKLSTPPPSRGRSGGGWVMTHSRPHPHPNPPLEGEGNLKCSVYDVTPNFCSISRHLSTPTIFVYSSNGVPVPTNFSSPLFKSASAVCMVLVIRSSSVMP